MQPQTNLPKPARCWPKIWVALAAGMQNVLPWAVSTLPVHTPHPSLNPLTLLVSPTSRSNDFQILIMCCTAKGTFFCLF